MKLGRSTRDSDPGHNAKIIWDAADGGAGPSIKDGGFSISRPGLWNRLTAAFLVNALALLNLSLFGGTAQAKSSTSLLPASPKDMFVGLTQDTPDKGTSPTPPAPPPPCVHHNSHNDKIMSTLGNQHLDQHGDLSC